MPDTIVVFWAIFVDFYSNYDSCSSQNIFLILIQIIEYHLILNPYLAKFVK